MHALMQEGWCDSVGSVQQIQAKLLKRQEAAAKRERAMAYALAHQVTFEFLTLFKELAYVLAQYICSEHLPVNLIKESLFYYCSGKQEQGSNPFPLDMNLIKAAGDGIGLSDGWLFGHGRIVF